MVSGSDGCTGDEEPFIINAVDWSGGELLVGLDSSGTRRLFSSRMIDTGVGPVSCEYGESGFVEMLDTNKDIAPGWTLPMIKRSHASAHSRITSVAYLYMIQPSAFRIAVR